VRQAVILPTAIEEKLEDRIETSVKELLHLAHTVVTVVAKGASPKEGKLRPSEFPHSFSYPQATGHV